MSVERLFSMPGLVQSYAALGRRRRPGTRPTVPNRRWILGPVELSNDQMQRYSRSLSLRDTPDVSVCFPQAFAGRLHMHMFGHREFPFSMAGAVHTWTKIEQRAPLEPCSRVLVSSWFSGLHGAKNGVEFETTTEVLSRGTAIWSSKNRYRVAGRFLNPPRVPEEPLDAPTDVSVDGAWFLGSALGRRYAASCSDWNPIHLSTASARLFGQKSSIVHGYANLAIAIDRLFANTRCRTVEAAFKGPASLGGKVFGRADSEGRLAVFTKDDPRPCIVARLTFEPPR